MVCGLPTDLRQYRTAATITGSDGTDYMFGSNDSDDELLAGDGDDFLFPSEGDDSMYGGAGDDLFYLQQDVAVSSGGAHQAYMGNQAPIPSYLVALLRSVL